jgi:hypothetical protein
MFPISSKKFYVIYKISLIIIKKFYPSSLYDFLRFIKANPVNKKILDCGAGGPNPKLAFFHENGFET